MQYAKSYPEKKPTWQLLSRGAINRTSPIYKTNVWRQLLFIIIDFLILMPIKRG